MLVWICWMLYQLKKILCLHSMALNFLVNSQFSREFLKMLMWNFLNSHHQISFNFLPQIQFVWHFVLFREKIHFVHEGPDVFGHVSMHNQWLLNFNGGRFVILNFVGYQSLFFVNAVDAVELQTFFKPQNRWFKLISQMMNSARQYDTVDHGFLNVAFEKFAFILDL